MAKKSGRQNLTREEKLDSIVNTLYESGIPHSTIFHTIVLLVLALTYSEDLTHKPIQISLSFNSISAAPDMETDSIKLLDEQPGKEEVSDIKNKESEILSEIIEKEITEESVVSIDEYVDVINQSNNIDKLLPTDLDLNQVIPVRHTEKHTNRHNADRSPSDIVEEIARSLPKSGRQFGGFSESTESTGGVGSSTQREIGRRLSKAGAKSGDVQISIAWNTRDDIDLHVYTRLNTGEVSTISWSNRVGVNGGMLDVDMNASFVNLVDDPVENVFWATGFAPNAEYYVGVHHFRSWSRNASVPVSVIVKVDQNTRTFNVNVSHGQPLLEVTRFRR
jgi:hypothetical protein